MEKCKKCGVNTSNKGGFYDNCLKDNSSDKINEILDISEERFNFMALKVAAMMVDSKSLITDNLKEIQNGDFNEIEKIYASFLLGKQIGNLEAQLNMTKNFMALFQEHPELKDILDKL